MDNIQQYQIELKKLSGRRFFPRNYTKIQYVAYIKSDEWRNKTIKIKKLRNNSCEICGSNHSLTVHHLTYKNIEHEQPEELALLCFTCHNTTHNYTDRRIIKPSYAAMRIIIGKRFGIESKRLKARTRNFFRRKTNLYKARPPAVVFL